MLDLIERVKLAFWTARFRKRLGIPMRGWWWNLGIPYMLTGRVPELSDSWKVLGPEQEKQ